jgi:hypothetical protein
VNERLALERSAQVVDSLVAGLWSEARMHFDANMRAKVSAERLAAGLRQVEQRAGPFAHRGMAMLRADETHAVVDTPLVFGLGTVICRVHVDDDGQVVDLLLFNPNRVEAGEGSV